MGVFTGVINSILGVACGCGCVSLKKLEPMVCVMFLTCEVAVYNLSMQIKARALNCRPVVLDMHTCSLVCVGMNLTSLVESERYCDDDERFMRGESMRLRYW